MDSSIPGKIPDVDQTQKAPAIGDKISERQPKDFQDYMNAPQTQQVSASESTQASKATPYELAQQPSSNLQTPTMDSLQSQSLSVSESLNDVNQKLNTKNLSLNQSQKYLLRNKLTEANSSVRSAATKAGVDVGEPPQPTSKLNPVQRFLSYVSDSQTQMVEIQKKLKTMSADGKALSPGDMLLIQVKMNKAQQALEYSSVLLGKAVEDIKTLFNVQI
jgi:hypothetical protein